MTTESEHREQVISQIQHKIEDSINQQAFKWIQVNSSTFNRENLNGRVNINRSLIEFLKTLKDKVKEQKDFREQHEYFCINCKIINIENIIEKEIEYDNLCKEKEIQEVLEIVDITEDNKK